MIADATTISPVFSDLYRCAGVFGGRSRLIERDSSEYPIERAYAMNRLQTKGITTKRDDLELIRAATGTTATSASIVAPRLALARHFVAAGSLILATLITLPATGGEVPRLFRDQTITAASFAQAVNHFIALGEEAAIAEMKGMVTNDIAGFARGANVNERVGWICRVIFEPRSGRSRPPGFGANHLPYHSMPAEKWPLYPVALSGSTYFVLSEGYTLAGGLEDPRKYIDYCRKNGVFRTKPITVPTRDQALKDAEALRQSSAWQAIKWTDSGVGWRISMEEEPAWEFIRQQAENM